MIQHKKKQPTDSNPTGLSVFWRKSPHSIAVLWREPKNPNFSTPRKKSSTQIDANKNQQKNALYPGAMSFFGLWVWGGCHVMVGTCPGPFWQIPKFPDSEPNQNNQTNFTNQTKKTCIDLVSAKKNTYTPCFFLGRVHSAFFLAAQCKIPSIQDQTQRFQWLSPQLWWLLAALVTKGGKRNTGLVGFVFFSDCLFFWGWLVGKGGDQ